MLTKVVVNERSVPCLCGVEEAEFYTAFVDEVYTDLTVVFETQLPPPINLRLFPTEESYYQVNPIAEQIPGVVAHALNSREEIAVALPRTQPLTEKELINNIRHEMTHLFASYLSDGNLTLDFRRELLNIWKNRRTKRKSSLFCYNRRLNKIAF